MFASNYEISGYEKSNWGWVLSQWQKQIGEWIQYQLQRFDRTLPNWSPNWSISKNFVDFLGILYWIILGLFFIWVIWRLWREFSPYIYAWLADERFSPEQNGEKSTPDLSVESLISRSQSLYRQGNYSEACRCLYVAMLQKLHEKKILRHKSSRTDGEYLQLLQLSVTPMQPYETLITTHEQLCFNNAEIQAENYQQCQQAYREIED
ncbi:DUF4129 domain-containing protein [Mastigocoleus testarum]|uniref:Protein-glutamine gamma-glutamyltransferase-like C-terminal domain-containing protein n=1 Tax=Mastigocoleus testarum BC008 TaxID=371196 RepID=A0A0V7ZII6_9CYAN|nr:DUF4129 domain-containing protein [Mastigocoleus testarum]KST64331.1 hypothetical protein BC008_17005 [Mastigocoleus testarum BC008]KST64384.1 hypothetical protein BC008_17290 [Mastigocoleus testarum BC008]